MDSPINNHLWNWFARRINIVSSKEVLPPQPFCPSSIHLVITWTKMFEVDLAQQPNHDWSPGSLGSMLHFTTNVLTGLVTNALTNELINIEWQVHIGVTLYLINGNNVKKKRKIKYSHSFVSYLRKKWSWGIKNITIMHKSYQYLCFRSSCV